MLKDAAARKPALFLLLLLLRLLLPGAPSRPAASFDSIVFEGGGVKGAVYAGALVALEEQGVLQGVKRFAGTSAGSTVAALLSAGYSSCELSAVTREVSFADLVEFPLFPRLKRALFGVGTMGLGRTLKRRKGLFSGDKLERTLDKLLGRKRCSVELGVPFADVSMSDLYAPADAGVNFGGPGPGPGDGGGGGPGPGPGDGDAHLPSSGGGRCASFRELTFQQLFESTGKELAVTGFDITNGTLVYFSRLTEPDMPVSKAVRISSSIPLVFEPVEWRGHLFMDGGVLRRIPVDAFATDSSMLAMKIMPDYSGTSPAELEALPLKAFVQRFTRAVFKQTQDLDLVQRAKKRGVQFVDFSGHQSVRSVSGVDFHLSEVAKARMWMAGYWRMRGMLEAATEGPWKRQRLPCIKNKVDEEGHLTAAKKKNAEGGGGGGGGECSGPDSCAWAHAMLNDAVRADGKIMPTPLWYRRWFVRNGLRLGVALTVLFALTSLMVVCRNGMHLIAIQNYSGIRTQRCDHCLRMWVPSQLPASQVQDLSLEEVTRALKARGIVVHLEEQKVPGRYNNNNNNDLAGPRARTGSNFCGSRTYSHRALQRSVYLENISLRRPWTIMSQSGFAPRVCCAELPINMNLMMALGVGWALYMAWLLGKATGAEDEEIPWLVQFWQS
jgi:predicted acylesterase/phospholipase RssA